MTIYSVHRRPGAARDATVLVGEKFSWGAFAFTVLWALWHRLWVVAAVLLAIEAAVPFAASLAGANELVAGLAGLAVNLIFGFEANALWAASLTRAGWLDVGLSHGRNVADAEFRYFHDLPDALATAPMEEVPPPPRPIGPPHDTLGLFGNV